MRRFSNIAVKCVLMLRESPTFPMIFLGVLSIFATPSISDDLVLYTYQAAFSMGYIIIILIYLIDLTIYFLEKANRISVITERFITRSSAMAIILWFIAVIGPMTSEFIQSSPYHALAICIAFICVSKAVSSRPLVLQSLPAFSHHPFPISQPAPHRVAVHETGHLLLYAALTPVPETLIVVVGSSAESPGKHGYVSRYFHPSTANSFMEWEMFCFLGGQVAEHYIYGHRSEGVAKDDSLWRAVARKYLCLDIANPDVSPTSWSKEAQLLQELRVRQEQVLWQFFEINRDVLQALSSLLLEKKRLYKADLIPYLEQVVLLSEIPRIATTMPNRSDTN